MNSSTIADDPDCQSNIDQTCGEFNTPTLKQRLKDIILDALDAPYTSRSSKEDLETGNHYQSVGLGNTQTKGFRTDRHAFLDQINFRDKKVLDLGSNLGEISRAARKRGAVLVDGFEYDAFFIEVANILNAYNGTTRVSFSRRDITTPSVYAERYDLVLAFSVFTYIRGVLDQIANSTDVLVLETHKLERNLETEYLAPIQKYFPTYHVLGETEWGNPVDPKQKRSVIVFAKGERELARALVAEGIKKGQPGECEMIRPVPPAAMSVLVDVRRTGFHDRFFSNFEFDSVANLFKAIAGLQVEVDSLVQSRDAIRYQYGGWVYWLLYLKGYLDYQEFGHIGRGNTYYDYFTKYYLPRAHDPGLSREINVPLLAIERIARRFNDLDRFQEAAKRGLRTPAQVVPISIIVTDPPLGAAQLLAVAVEGSDVPLNATAVDGWHRLFGARLFGVESLRGDVVVQRLMPEKATVLVVSKGDDRLLDLSGRVGGHFPQAPEGWYAGYHPADSAEAIAHLQDLRGRGWQYLMIPPLSLWWLDHYMEFSEYLERHCERVWSNGQYIIYRL